ncbi:hypothetical protein HK102_012341, partial [Quaeritorhiza haematococci]
MIMAYVRQWNALSIESPAGYLIDSKGGSTRRGGPGPRLAVDGPPPRTGPSPRTKWSRLASSLEKLQSRVDWDRMHIEVQSVLEGIWESVSAAAPHALSKAGRMSSIIFPLFSYRVFYRRSLDEDDPIIAGVNIKDEGGQFRITADLGGEESGEILVREEFSVPRDPESLADAVRRALHAGSTKIAAGERCIVTTSDEKNAFLERAVAEMATYTLRYLSQVVGVQDGGTGRFLGSGFFCQLGGKKIVVTARHVIQEAEEAGLRRVVFGRGDAMPPGIADGDILLFDDADLAFYTPDGVFPLPESKGYWPEDRIEVQAGAMLRDYLIVAGFPGRF